MRYLAIDLGQKRTGLAVCDEGETIACPLAVLQGRSIVGPILEIIEKEQIDAVVLGLPLNMDGTEGAQAKLVRGFGEQIGLEINLPIYFQDERLSSFEAEKKLSGHGLTHKKKKRRLDAIAAAAILQSFLDTKHTK